MPPNTAERPGTSLPIVAGYVLGYLFAVAAGPILLPDLPGRGLSLAMGLLAVCIGCLRLHLCWVICSLLSPVRSRAVLNRVDAGSALLLLCAVLLRMAGDPAGNKLDHDLLCLLAVAALGGSLIMLRQARHAWFASSFLSEVDASRAHLLDEG